MPRLLTGDAFFALVDKDTAAREKAATEKETRKKRKEGHTKALAEWKTRDEARKEQNNTKREACKQAVGEWEAQRDLAKAEGKKWTRGKKPTLGGLEKAEPKPKAPALPEVDEGGSSGWEDSDDGDE